MPTNHLPHARRWHPSRFIQASIGLHLLALFWLFIEPQNWRWPIALIIVNHLCISLIGLWPRSTWLGPNWIRLPQHCGAVIALTIDDGPDPDVTPQVLALLDRYQVKATFFCIGAQAQRYPELCREIVARGHAIENHSQHHRHHFSLMGSKKLAAEIDAAQTTLTAITGRAPQFFRAPAGLRNPFLEPVLAHCGLQLAAWSRRGFDTRVGDPNRVAQRLLHGLKAGAILLLHDGHCARTDTGVPVILTVLPTLFEAATARDLGFVTLAEAQAAALTGSAA